MHVHVHMLLKCYVQGTVLPINCQAIVAKMLFCRNRNATEHDNEEKARG